MGSAALRCFPDLGARPPRRKSYLSPTPWSDTHRWRELLPTTGSRRTFGAFQLDAGCPIPRNPRLLWHRHVPVMAPTRRAASPRRDLAIRVEEGLFLVTTMRMPPLPALRSSPGAGMRGLAHAREVYTRNMVFTPSPFLAPTRDRFSSTRCRAIRAAEEENAEGLQQNDAKLRPYPV